MMQARRGPGHPGVDTFLLFCTHVPSLATIIFGNTTRVLLSGGVFVTLIHTAIFPDKLFCSSS